MTNAYKGSCLCGAVTFEVDAFLSDIGHCHCSMCRKFHGAPYATIASVALDDFRWIKGVKDIKPYTAANGTTRSFCRHCGSSLTFSSPRASDAEIEIALGVMDDDVPVKPNAHIFVGSAANWSEISDGLPQYEMGRDSKKRN